ncbi:hypothetical protein A2U01_0060157, partial [Trifolium medium]|nr:hypothetical protein [Trifolium medium]
PPPTAGTPPSTVVSSPKNLCTPPWAAAPASEVRR